MGKAKEKTTVIRAVVEALFKFLGERRAAAGSEDGISTRTQLQLVLWLFFEMLIYSRVCSGVSGITSGKPLVM